MSEQKQHEEHVKEQEHRQAPPTPAEMRNEQPGAAERQEALRQAQATQNKEEPTGWCGKFCSTVCCGWCATCC